MDKLVSQCIAGEKGAFDALVKGCSPTVKAAIAGALHKYSFPASRENIEDLHNGLFLTLMEDDFRRLRQFQGRSSFYSYIRVVTVRYVIDFLRKQKKSTSLDSDDCIISVPDNCPSPEKKLELSQELDLVRRAVARLTPREQLLLKLVFVKEAAPTKICEILGLSMTAYYNQKSRLVKKIKTRCEESALDSSKH